jgi:hypothetical protein
MKRPHGKVLVCALAEAVLVACGAPSPPLPPSLELPKPVGDLRAARKGDRVYLAWTVPSKTTERLTVRHLGPTQICRNRDAEPLDCNHPAARIPATQFRLTRSERQKNSTPAAKVQASYVDLLPQAIAAQNPTAEIHYAVSVLNESGRSAGLSNQVSVPAAPTLPPPEHFTAQVNSDGVLLSWDCPAAARAEAGANPALDYRLRIYRREQEQKTDTRIGERNFTDCSLRPPADHTAGELSRPLPQFLDQTFQWERRYDYHATVVTVISQPAKSAVEVEGDDTPLIQVYAHDVFPPTVPNGLQAVFSGVGQAPSVDLVWSPDSEADLVGYNIFRREAGGQTVKLNSTPVRTPAYRDTGVQPGKRYLYSVSAVDERNNESARSEEASEQVP